MMRNQRLTWGAAIATLCTIATLARADYQQGYELFTQGKYREAAEVMQGVVDTHPNYGYGHYLLGMSRMQLKQNDVAVEHLKKAVELQGDKSTFHLGLGQAYYRLGQYGSAVQAFNAGEQYLASDSERKQLYKWRGLSYTGQRNNGRAISDLEKALQYGSDATIQRQLGNAYFADEKFREAARALEQSGKSDAATQVLISRSYIQLAKRSSGSEEKSLYRKAYDAAKSARQQSPSDYDAVNSLGRAALGMGSYGEAADAFNAALGIQPSNCYARYNLGQAQQGNGRMSSALSEYEKAKKCMPDNWVVHNSIGFVLEKQKNLQGALSAYEDAKRYNPGSNAVKASIERVRQNIAINQENQQIDAEQARLEAEEREAQAEYNRKMKEFEDYEKKRQDYAEDVGAEDSDN